MSDDFSQQIDEIFSDILEPLKQPEYEKSEFVKIRVLRNHAVMQAVFEHIKEAGIYKEAFLCGGFVRHSCSNRKPIIAVYGDIDVYCTNDETYEKLNAFFTNHRGFRIQFENDLSKSFVVKQRMHQLPKPIQLIKPVREGNIIAYGTMEEILNNFDFTVIRAGIDMEMYFNDKHAMVDSDFDKHEMAKRLVFKKIHCPISSLHRVIKYGRKGYKINSKETLKLFLDWESRPESYKTEIKEFLKKEFKLDPRTGQLDPIAQVEVNRMYRMLRVD